MKVFIQGVPAYGLIDSGADITIIGGSLFKKVATVARLRKKNFMKADKVPRTYNQQPFQLDGRMDLDVVFGDKQVTTPVYIKMHAHDQLLRSEGVCRQLGVIQYHHDVETWRGGRKKSTPPTPESKPQEEPQPPATDLTPSATVPHAAEQGAKVPTVRVNLVQSVQLLPHQSLVVEVSFAGDEERNDVEAYLLEPTELRSGLQLEPSLLSVSPEDGVLAVVNNPTGCSMLLEEGTLLGEATPVSLVESAPDTRDPVSDIPEDLSALRWIQTQPTAWRQQKLVDSLGSLETLTAVQQQKLLDFFKEHHTAFALEEGERGETDLVELHIDTGEA